jgi:hypothetical protein
MPRVPHAAHVDRPRIILRFLMVVGTESGGNQVEIPRGRVPHTRQGCSSKGAVVLMELSGEVAGSCFFEGVLGIQFVSKSSLKRTAKGLNHDRVFWLNAADLTSDCVLRGRS